MTDTISPRLDEAGEDKIDDATQARKDREEEFTQLRNTHVLALRIQAATFSAAINQMADLCGSWFTNIQGFDRINFDGDCMLVVTELAEAVEGDRRNNPDDHVPEFDSREVEVADALVRLLHLSHKYSLRLTPAFLAKMEYNLGRPFKHGKGY